MDWTSAPITEDAPLEPAHRRFLPAWISAVFLKVEAYLESERAQLPLWFATAFGTGSAAWLWLPSPRHWIAFIIIALGVAATTFAAGLGGNGRALLLGPLAMAAGCSLIWARAEWVAAPALERPLVTVFEAKIEQVEARAAKGDVRLTLATETKGLPPVVRVSVPEKDVPAGLGQGAEIRLRARLQPPPPMALPGSHDFARDLWFQ